jgi:hypothetical protein
MSTIEIEPFYELSKKLRRKEWCGLTNADHQPVDERGRVLDRAYSHIRFEHDRDLRLYVPRLMNNIARTARAARFARRREQLWWARKVWPLVEEVYAAGGRAFAGDHGDTFSYWRVDKDAHRNGQLSFCRERHTPPQNAEPIVQVADTVVTRELHETNRELGLALTRVYARIEYSGDLTMRRRLTETCLMWALQEKIRREVGPVTETDDKPRVVHIHIDSVGAWVFVRTKNGSQWEVASQPGMKIATIEITP